MDESTNNIDIDLDEVLKRERPKLRTFVAMLISNRQSTGSFDEEDITQEALTEFFKVRSKGTEIKHPRAYLKTTARRKLLRKTKTEKAVPMENADREVEKAAVVTYLRDSNQMFLQFQIAELLKTFSEKDQQIFNWCLVERQSARELALELGTSTAAIHTKTCELRRKAQMWLLQGGRI